MIFQDELRNRVNALTPGQTVTVMNANYQKKVQATFLRPVAARPGAVVRLWVDVDGNEYKADARHVAWNA